MEPAAAYNPFHVAASGQSTNPFAMPAGVGAEVPRPQSTPTTAAGGSPPAAPAPTLSDAEQRVATTPLWDSGIATLIQNPNPWTTWVSETRWTMPQHAAPSGLIIDTALIDSSSGADITDFGNGIHARQRPDWDWASQNLTSPKESLEGDSPSFEMNFEEPEFPKTGIPEVDAQIREGIIERQRREWHIRKDEVRESQKLISMEARRRREAAVTSITAAATAAISKSTARGRSRALAPVLQSAKELETYLERNLSISTKISEWTAMLAADNAEVLHGNSSASAAHRISMKDSTMAKVESTPDARSIRTAKVSTDGAIDAGDVDAWELAHHEVELLGVLGAGEFGEVRQGILRRQGANAVPVAVKTAKKHKKQFLAEAHKMKKLKHRNIVTLCGVCTQDEPALIVLEFMEGGCLLDFVSHNGANLIPQHHCMMLGDVAAGLAYLHRNHWLHGDLAARNLLVGGKFAHGEIHVKICDFGHATQTDDDNTPILVSRQLALRWSAPELYESRRCSPATDIWSYGVVVYEVLSMGKVPYNTFTDNKEVMKKVQTGWRMPREKGIWKQFYDMMLACWHAEPGRRPSPTALYDCCKKWENAPGLHTSAKESLKSSKSVLKFEY